MFSLNWLILKENHGNIRQMLLNGNIFRQETAFFVFATPRSDFFSFFATAARTYSQRNRAKKPFPSRLDLLNA
jgi:hypothetical protein